MMVMGYLLAPKKGGRRRRGKDQPSAAAHHGENDDGLRETLLEQQQQPASSSSPTAGGGGVPKGYFAVYVGEEARRFVVPTGYLREPAFRDLMERAADEFGFAQAGGLRGPCGVDDFEVLLRRLRRKNGGAAAAKAKKAIS